MILQVRPLDERLAAALAQVNDPQGEKVLRSGSEPATLSLGKVLAAVRLIRYRLVVPGL